MPYVFFFSFHKIDLDVRPKSLISSNHPLFHRGIFSFLLPSIPTLHLSTSTHTQGLSRHSSRSTLRTTSATTAGRRVSLPVTHNENSSASTSSSFASQLTRLLKRFGSNHHRRRYSSSTSTTMGSSQQQRLSNRTLSTSTVRTNISTSSTSWSQVRLSDGKKERSISFASMKQKKSLRGQVSAPMVGMHRRVQLTRRPTLTVGTVEFIGHVNFADGIWIGVELDRRGMWRAMLQACFVLTFYSMQSGRTMDLSTAIATLPRPPTGAYLFDQKISLWLFKHTHTQNSKFMLICTL